MKWFICCGGKMARWNGYLNRPKHCVVIQNETLIARTTRLIQKYDPECSVQIIITSNQDANQYQTPGAKLQIITPEDYESFYQTLAIESVLTWGGKLDNNTIMLFGDVFYTNNCIMQICIESKTARNIIWFGRGSYSNYTGKSYGELWGMTFGPDHIDHLYHAISNLNNMYKSGSMSRLKHWELYRYLNGIPLNQHQIKGNFVEINDYTEDFDCPCDYDTWIKQYKLIYSPLRDSYL